MVVFVTDGWVRVNFAFCEFDLRPGSVLTVPPGLWSQGSPQGFVRAAALYLHTGFIDSQLPWVPSAHPVVRRLVRQPLSDRRPGVVDLGERAIQLLRPKLALIEALSEAPWREFTVLAHVADLFGDIGLLARAGGGAGPSGDGGRGTPRAQTAQAARALYDRLEYPWAISELARIVSLSESQLNRVFRQDLGTSPAAFLWGMRVDRMAELLASTTRSVADVANATGWANPSAAARAFKRRYGVSPRSFAMRARSIGMAIAGSGPTSRDERRRAAAGF